MEYSNILIIKMSSVGDIIHAIPTAAALRERFPKAKISWLVHPQFAGFIPEAPCIDEVLYFDKVAFKKMSWSEKLRFMKNFRDELHAKHFDLVIDLQGLFKSGAVAAMTGCKNKIGYCEMREGSGLISKAVTGTHAKDHVIERYLDVARYLGAKVEGVHFPMSALKEETAKIHKILKEKGLEEEKKYVVLVPGARWETKQWPVEYYAKLAELLIEADYAVVLAGGPADKPLGEKIVELTKGNKEIFDLIGNTSLKELAVLIRDGVFFISGDTGPLHMASAYGKPLISMYGPTKPERTGPYGNPKATVLVADMPCAGCLKKHCEDWKCMYSMTPEMVLKIFKEKMESEASGARQ